MSAERGTRKVWHLFWAWQDEREERWLREMALQGWHLRRPGLVRYTFDQGDPTDVVYRLDYRVLAARDREEYLGLFRAAGWEHVGAVSNWQYFRTPATAGSAPDIFSDTESRVAMFQRLLTILIVFIPVLNIGMMNMLRHPPAARSVWVEGVFAGVTVLYVTLMLLWAYAIVRIAMRMRSLRRRAP
jgi:hypothetical protein